MSTSVLLTSQQLVKYYQKAVDEHWGYVWSLNGELYTKKLAQEYHDKQRSTSEHRDPATYWLTDCAKWIGKMAADCSGGIVGAIRTVNPTYKDGSANTLFNERCSLTGPISTIPEVPGLCVWRSGHIGIYEGNGYVLEFRGTDYGAVRTKLKSRNFTHWGYLHDVNYKNKEEDDVAKVIKVTDPIVFDQDVKDVQILFNRLGYLCGPEDGKAGKKTMDGIEAFCTAHLGIHITDLDLFMVVDGKQYKIELKEV